MPRARARGSVGGITKGIRLEVDGLKALEKNLRRISNQARVQILNNAVEQGAVETLDIMQALAPRSSGTGTRGYHGADRLRIMKIFSRRDSRAAAVGISTEPGGAWFLKFAEFGTEFQPDDPFIRPTANAMRKRMPQIVLKWWKRAMRRGLR